MNTAQITVTVRFIENSRMSGATISTKVPRPSAMNRASRDGSRSCGAFR
ncbi:hypothetical protein TSOC111612_14950 [Tsukamurella ocularis]